MAKTPAPANSKAARRAASRGNTDTATTAKAEKAPRTPKVKERKPCQCFSVLDGDTYVSCGQTTTGRFAPGHDAKLKSVLMDLAVADFDYVRVTPDGTLKSDPVTLADELGWRKFVDKATQRAFSTAKRKAARAAEKAERDAKREADKAAKAEAAKEAKAAKAAAKVSGERCRVKVGRSIFEATKIEAADGKVKVRYTDGAGKDTTKTVDESAILPLEDEDQTA